MLRRDFQVLSAARAREARTRLRTHSYDGADYLDGLAVENALKACLARATQRYEFPDRYRANRVHSHDLEDLLRAAELEPRLRSANPVVQAAWARAKDWSVETHYRRIRAKPSKNLSIVRLRSRVHERRLAWRVAGPGSGDRRPVGFDLRGSGRFPERRRGAV